MKTFKQLLNELFQQHYPYKKTVELGDSNHPHIHEYEFETHNKSKYKINIDHTIYGKNNHHAEVHFSHVNEDGHEQQHITNNKKDESHKVFGTVHHIVKNHIKSYPEVSNIKFSSHNKEPSRTKLYRTISNKLSHSHEETHGSNYTQFKINTKNLK